jgi:hypothetical protein
MAKNVKKSSKSTPTPTKTQKTLMSEIKKISNQLMSVVKRNEPKKKSKNVSVKKTMYKKIK